MSTDTSVSPGPPGEAPPSPRRGNRGNSRRPASVIGRFYEDAGCGSTFKYLLMASRIKSDLLVPLLTASAALGAIPDQAEAMPMEAVDLVAGQIAVLAQASRVPRGHLPSGPARPRPRGTAKSRSCSLKQLQFRCGSQAW